MKLTVVLSLFCAVAFADGPEANGSGKDAQRPVCNAETRGQFWPPAANADRDAARRLVQQGELQMCTVHRWRYKWKPLSVNVRDLVLAKQKR